jgi:hypothetical protein
MSEFRALLISLTLSILASGCWSEKTWLSEEIKEVNPYQDVQKLTFVSSEGVENAIVIMDIQDNRFPDGLGAFRNERMFVSAFRPSKSVRGGIEKRILTVLAKTDKYTEQIDFSLSLKDTYLRMNFVSFSDYKNRTIIDLSTDSNSYNDVIHFTNYPNRKIYDNEIVEFYWSKSKGYVRLIQSNGVVWDLKDVE